MFPSRFRAPFLPNQLAFSIEFICRYWSQPQAVARYTINFPKD